jgi:hypothetical protein
MRIAAGRSQARPGRIISTTRTDSPPAPPDASPTADRPRDPRLREPNDRQRVEVIPRRRQHLYSPCPRRQRYRRTVQVAAMRLEKTLGVADPTPPGFAAFAH